MIENQDAVQNPHSGQPIRLAGEPLDRARAALLMIHGRGARAEDILSLAGELAVPGFAYLAPQARNNTWYPNRFLDPIVSNQPWLSSALSFMGKVLSRITAAGIPPGRTLLLGFSQGACLTLEYTFRQPQRYGGVVGFSGALIGPDNTTREAPGSLAGTPVFLGCSDVDPHVPKERVEDAATVLGGMGGIVTLRLYPNMDHTVNLDEIEFVRGMMQPLVAGS